MTLVHHFLENSANAFPDKVALIHEDTRATYSEINSKANQLANLILSQGVKQGDRVVFIFENCLEYVVSYYGALKAGAVAVPLSGDLKPEGIIPLLAELEPAVIISSPRFERVLNQVDSSLLHPTLLLIKTPKLKWEPGLQVLSWDEVVKDNDTGNNPNTPIEPGDLASIIYTSGSTGQPKGVMLTHRNIAANAASICSYLHISQNDIQMVVLPFFYVMGKSLLNTHMAAGATVIINNKFAFPAGVISQMVDERVTSFSGVSSTFAYLLHRSPLEKLRNRLVTLRYCSQAGGHMSGYIKRELRRVLPSHTQIYIMYGATEAAARLTYLEPEKYDEKIGSIGKPLPGVTIRILDEKGNQVPTGQAGELVAAGLNITPGYWKDPEATVKVLTRHGYHTGDIGYMDPDGFLYIESRKDAQLKVGGRRLNPQEIGDALMATGLLIEAIVVGLPDELMGNKLVALVTPKNGDCSKNMILSQAAKLLPKYKLPSEIKLARALPKSANGKIDRPKCIELVSG